MLARRPLLERHGVQNVLIAIALAISAYMLAPPYSPVLSQAEGLPFFGSEKPERAELLTVGPLPADFKPVKRKPPTEAKGILMTGYTAGGRRFEGLVEMIDRTELNAVVIDIKDERGDLSWMPKSPQAAMAGAGRPKILEPAATIRKLKQKGVYVIGRIVTFQDNFLSRVRPDLAVQDLGGGIWENRKGLGWLDPYSVEAQDYAIAIAIEAIELGFDEIQFDYIRFPTDGDVTKMWFPHKDERLPHGVIADFLARARQQIVPRGAYMSTDLFGLVALVTDDLGIGQRLELIAPHVDYVSLMLYPSHYSLGNYGIPDPEKDPYKTVSLSLKDAQRRIAGTGAKLRPWIQDFTLRVPYTPVEVRAQIDAVEDLGINDWLLWNARNRYTEDALRVPPGVKMPTPEPDEDLVSR
ncbi:MAG: putative glycoside hydrolase [Actinomycetota bacterium]